jgi:hypothetical protein
VGGYRVEQVPCEDFDFWRRLKWEGRLANRQEALIEYRVHGNNVSFVQQEARHRTASEVATRSVIEAGLAATASEADEFIRLKRKVHSEQLSHVTLDEANVYCKFVERFIADYVSAGRFGSDVAEIRRTIRWQFLNRTRQHSVFSREYRQWLGLAVRIDPDEMQIKKVVGRAVKRIARRVAIALC